MGAVCGNLLGARYGDAALPPSCAVRDRGPGSYRRGRR
ncbi:hypothetical protein [Streptomyces sp. H27-D2]